MGASCWLQPVPCYLLSRSVWKHILARDFSSENKLDFTGNERAYEAQFSMNALMTRLDTEATLKWLMEMDYFKALNYSD